MAAEHDTTTPAAAAAAATGESEPRPDERDREPPHGDPLTTPGEEGTRHGDTPPLEDGDGAGEAAEESAPGAGGDDAPPVDPEQKAQQYLELAQRKQAEFENFRRRMNLQVAQAEDRGVAKLAKELLPALDHLELALEAAEKHEGAGEWVKGIRLVQEEVLGALGRVGIQSFAPFGEPFDPNEHEAISQQPAGEGEEPGTVSQVYQAGYRLNGAVLRPARVVVAG